MITGESGSGKSTCAMSIALRFAEENSNVAVFEYTEGSTTLRETLQSLNKYLNGGKAVLLMDELHIFSGEIDEAFSDRSFSNIRVLSSARSGEWRSRISIQLPKDVTTVNLNRFQNADIDGLINKTLEHLPAPAFTKLTRQEQRQRFEKSKKQLLIALREVTQSAVFDDILQDEFSRILDIDARRLFLLVALTTLARAGISRSAARTIYESLKSDASFDSLLSNHLEGIVDASRLDRLQTRHEYYAKHIVENNANFVELADAFRAILEYFCQFQMPVIKHVGKIDSQLFKFLLNNKFVYDLFKRDKNPEGAIEFFQQFEAKLQLDGHYWLQYGLLLRRAGHQEEAYRTLSKSIQAYPENDYAQHALAQQKLIAAGLRPKYDNDSKRLIDEAVEFLLDRHFRMDTFRRERAIDEYPLVTLGYYHVDTLIKLRQIAEAQRIAKDYFEKVQDLSKRNSSDILEQLRGRLLLLYTTGEWNPLRQHTGRITYFD